jgi:hypothetical protein
VRALDAATLLDLWEHGLAQPLPRRAAALVHAAWPDVAEADVLAWPLGRRDARLLALRRRLFGSGLTLIAPCPSCGVAVELAFRVEDVLLPQSREVRGTREAREPREEMQVIERDGYVIAFRPPASSDLLALAEAPRAADRDRDDGGDRGGDGDSRLRLLERCVTDLRRADGAAATIEELPAGIVAAITAGMAAADPQADVQLACACPACGRTWPALFDIASVLWSEIHVWARRLLRDVHTLARAYGWREADVLALSPTRRQIYLELARS